MSGVTKIKQLKIDKKFAIEVIIECSLQTNPAALYFIPLCVVTIIISSNDKLLGNVFNET